MIYNLSLSGENIAWLLNIRGRDTNYTPIPNAYLILNKKKQMHFFCDPKKVDKLFKNKYKNIKFIDIKFFDLYLSKIKNKNVLIELFDLFYSLRKYFKKK